MNSIKRFFVRKENKMLKKLLVSDTRFLKKGYNFLETENELNFGDTECSMQFGLVDNTPIMELSFKDQSLKGQKESANVVVEMNQSHIAVECDDKLKLNKKVLTDLMVKYSNTLKVYQDNQMERYKQFIKELRSGEYSVKENLLEGQKGKVLTLLTNQGFHLHFSREMNSLLIQIRDSEELYLKRLDYSLEKESFVNATTRKIDISTESKEDLIAFIQEFIDSKHIFKLFDDRELLISQKTAGE